MINRFEGNFAFLSNFYPSPVCLDGVEYPTVEHAYQASKTENEYERRLVGKCSTPGQAKRTGRMVTLRPDWDNLKLKIMYELLRQKFFWLEDPNQKLLSTGIEELIEGNEWHDNFWGICSCGVCTGGSNFLGKILMNLRAHLYWNSRE